MKNNIENWKRMQFKKNKVWLSIDKNGSPIDKNGKVLIKYQLDQEHEYWVHKKSVHEIDPSLLKKSGRGKKSEKKQSGKTQKKSPVNNEIEFKNTIRVYTDGASSGNPGPSGIGVLLIFDGYEKKISKYIGDATNNIAELEAIKTGIRELKKKDLPIRIFTDSGYAYGVLELGWKAKKNTKLISSIKKLMFQFKDIKILKIKGHAGHDGNEQADKLATSAIKKHKEVPKAN